MAGVNVKMGVTGVSEFKKGMKEAESAVSTLNSALKLNESELKATGNKEQFLVNKTNILKDAIEKQTEAVRQAEQALAAMRSSGVDQTSTAFQQMQQKVYNAATKLNDFKTELNNTEQGAKDTNAALEDIGKNVSWQTLSDGIGKITEKLQSAARTAVRFGKTIARSAMDSASWADDILERAEKYGVDAETLQRMENVSEYIETDVETIVSAKDKLSRNKDKLTDLLGFSADGKEIDDLIWDVGDAILSLSDDIDKSDISQQLFGKSWRDLIPLFNAGREKYEELMASQDVLTNEQVKNLGTAADAFAGIQQQIELMKNQFWADNADKIVNLMQWLIDNADSVKDALVVIGAGFGALKLADMATNIGSLVSGFKTLGLIKGGETATAVGTSATGSGIGSFLGSMLDKITIFAAANAASQAFEVPKLYEGLKDMNEAERTKYIIQHDTGMTNEQYYQMQWDKLQEGLDEGSAGGHSFEVKVEPVAADDAAANLSAQVGVVTIPAQLAVAGGGLVGSTFAGLFGGSSGGRGFANGLPFVPFDGYPAILHKGERVLTASENRNYTYNSNNYFGSVNLNNGQDIEALCDSIDRHNRRRQSGFGE